MVAELATVKRIFLEVAAVSKDRHESLLASLCANEEGAIEQVRALLAHAESDLPQFPGPQEFQDPDESERIGKFTILRRLGEGGMGVVYLARSEEPPRDVALKVVPAGADNEMIMRRFRTECELLARFEHPNIARIYESGVVEGPVAFPFFALEFVDGEPISVWCAKNQLSVRERLELCATVAEAIHYAHERGVVHRDLKPENILVGRDGVPKILDFGLARCVEPSEDQSRLTREGVLLGTLAYMSPEQAAGDDDVDARADVYSLGVLCYEILAGQRPFELSSRAGVSFVKTILECEPVRLRLRNPALDRDLECVVSVAMSKDRESRYESAKELARDLRRYLDGLAVVARGPARWYRLRKHVARARRPILWIGLVLCLSLAGGWWWSRRGGGALAREEYFAAAQECLQRLEAGFNAEDRDDLLNLAEHLRYDDRTRGLVEGLLELSELRNHSQTVVMCNRLLAEIDRERGEFRRAIDRYQRANAAQRRDSGQDKDEYIKQEADLRMVIGEEVEALELLRSIGASPPDCKKYESLANVASDGGAFRRAIDLFERAGDPAIHNSSHVSLALLNRRIAGLYCILGEYESAEGYVAHALRALDDSPDVVELVWCRNTLGVIYRDSGRFAAAEREFQYVLDKRMALEASGEFVGAVMNNWGRLEERRRSLQQARRLFGQAWGLGDESSRVRSDASLGLARLQVLHDPQGAIVRAREALQSRESKFYSNHRLLGEALAVLGLCRAAAGYADGREKFRQGRGIVVARLGDDNALVRHLDKLFDEVVKD